MKTENAAFKKSDVFQLQFIFIVLYFLNLYAYAVLPSFIHIFSFSYSLLSVVGDTQYAKFYDACLHNSNTSLLLLMSEY